MSASSAAAGQLISGVDFVAVPTHDLKTAVEFCRVAMVLALTISCVTTMDAI